MACYQLALVDLHLAPHFEVKGRQATLLFARRVPGNVGSILQLHPQDWTAQYCRFSAYKALGWSPAGKGARKKAFSISNGRFVTARSSCRLKMDPELIRDLAECRCSLAQLLRQKGDDKKARTLILANFRMLAISRRRTQCDDCDVGTWVRLRTSRIRGTPTIRGALVVAAEQLE